MMKFIYFLCILGLFMSCGNKDLPVEVALETVAVEPENNDSTYRKIYYQNGELASEGDAFDGLQKIYYESGQLCEEGNFKDMNRDGLWKFYYENGKLKKKEII